MVGYVGQFDKWWTGTDVTSVGLEEKQDSEVINILFPYGIPLNTNGVRTWGKTKQRVIMVDNILNKICSSV